jgi:hypothetical protein
MAMQPSLQNPPQISGTLDSGEAMVRQDQSWISLIGSCILLALAAALALAIIVAGASVALASHQASELQNATSGPPSGVTFSGMITDSRCGARHRKNSRMSPAECTRACLRNGATYVLVDGERRYTLAGNTDDLGELAGTRVNVTGTRDGSRIMVGSATPMF